MVIILVLYEVEPRVSALPFQVNDTVFAIQCIPLTVAQPSLAAQDGSWWSLTALIILPLFWGSNAKGGFGERLVVITPASKSTSTDELPPVACPI